jgi:hypothetical protein
MEKREKVLIALMIIALGIGAFELFVRPAVKSPAPVPTVNVDEALNLATTISQSTAKAALEDDEDYVLRTAAAPWANDPIYAWRGLPAAPPMAGEQEEVASAEQIRAATVYSGYLEMGTTRIAIINGLEYQAGEMLADGRHLILNIAPDRVILRADREKQEIIIPYQDAFIEE